MRKVKNGMSRWHGSWYLDFVMTLSPHTGKLLCAQRVLSVFPSVAIAQLVHVASTMSVSQETTSCRG